MNLDKSERMLEHHREMRDKLEMDLIKMKRAEKVDEAEVKKLQLTIASLTERITAQERLVKRYE